MYSVKNMTKGRFAEFNITDYENPLTCFITARN